MRIYLAGIYAGGRGALNTTSENLAVTADLEYPWMLESYHYIGKTPRLTDVIRKKGDQIFLDSGAFSAFTQNATIDLPGYAAFIEKNQDIIEIAASLDVIGSDCEQASYDNLKALEALGAKVLPTHHARDADHWVQQFLDDGYEYICLGGMVPESTPWLKGWLDKMWGTYLTNEDGTAKIKVHGFGLTTLQLMYRYPWYSVDSTSWVMASRFGTIYVDLPQPDGTIKDIKIKISDRSPSVRKLDAHFDSMAPLIQEELRDYIEGTLGYDMKLLSELYGWRDHFNIEYFRRAMDRDCGTFFLEQEGFF